MLYNDFMLLSNDLETHDLPRLPSVSTAYDDISDVVRSSEYNLCGSQSYQETLTAIEGSASLRPLINSQPNMSTASAQSNATIVDLEADFLPLLDSITNLAVDPPSLYIDLKGIDLSRHGSISILSLHIAPTQKTYLIDIHSLGRAAFSTTNNTGTSLKTILESSAIPKVVFDIRNDSDALFSLFQISIDGIKDLQLMELAYRTGEREFVCDLARCIEKDSPVSTAAKTDWRLTKERCHRLYAPEEGGCYQIFNERPLNPEITQHCKQDVEFLLGLYEVYSIKLRQPGQAFWRVRVRETTKDRIKLSHSSDYDGKSKRNAFGWNDQAIEDDIESWNDILMMEISAGQYVLNENDDWVPAPNDDYLEFLPDEEEEHDDNDDDDWGNDTARDCIRWEDDMIKNGEFF